MFPLKQIRSAALLLSAAFLAITPAAHADSYILSFQFTASDLVNAFHATNSTPTTPTAYFAVFLAPESIPGYQVCPEGATNCQETAPVDPSNSATGLTQVGEYSDNNTNKCLSGCSGDQYAFFSKPYAGGDTSNLTLIPDTSTTYSLLAGKTHTADGTGPVQWGQTGTQTISSTFYSTSELFQFDIVVSSAFQNLTSVTFQGYLDKVSLQTGAAKATYANSFQMTLNVESSVVAAPEPRAWLLTGSLLLGLAALRLRMTRMRSRGRA